MRNPTLKKSQFISLFLLMGIFLSAQPTKTDSLIQELAQRPEDSAKVDLLINLSRRMLYSQPKESQKYARQGAKLSEALPYISGQITSLQLVGYYYRNQGNLDSALYHFKATLGLAQKEKDTVGIAASLTSIGNIHNQKGDFEPARTYYRQSIKVSEAIGDSLEVAKTFANMATTHVHQGNYKEAKKAFLSSLDYFLKLGHASFAGTIYNNLTPIYMNEGKPDTALLLVKRTQKVFKAQNNLKALSNSEVSLANIHQRMSNFDSALYHLQTGLDIMEEIKDTLGMSLLFSKRGAIYNQQGYYEKALTEYLKYLKISEAKGDQKGVAIAHKQIGVNYRNQQMYEQAEAYFLKGLEIAEKIELKKEIGDACTKLGENFMDKNDREQAIQYFNRAKSVLEPINYLPGLANVTQKLGLLYQKNGQVEIATTAFQQSLEIAQALKNRHGETTAYLHLGQLQNEQGLYQSALTNLKQAENTAIALEDIPLAKSVFQSLATTYQGLGQFESAFQYFKRYTETKDSLANRQRLQQVAEIQTRFETEKLQRELLEEKIRNQEKESQVRLLLFSLGLLLSVLIIGGLIYQNRLKTKNLLLTAAKQEQQIIAIRSMVEGQEKERARIARDLHDGLGNLLATVKANISNLQFNITSQTIYQKAHEMIDEACTEVRKIAHEMMPRALDKLGLKKALEDLVTKMDNTHSFDAQLNIYGKEQILPDSTNIMLYRIVQELMNNIVKYASPKEVILQMTYSEDWLNLTVEDDGKGFNTTDITPDAGMGLKSIAFRTQYIGGTYEIDSRPNMGTLVSINVPLSNNSIGLT